MNKAGALFFVLVLAVSILFGSQMETRSQSADQIMSDNSIGWYLEAEAKELQDYLKYPGSTLDPIIKIHVTYHENGSEAYGYDYEDLYYRGCDPIGSRRQEALEVNPDKLGIIRIKESGGQISEGKSCAYANCVVRLLLDCYVLGNAPAYVIVPSSCFTAVLSNLRHDNFYPYEPKPDEPVRADCLLSLWSDSGDLHQSLYYTGS